MGKSRFKHTKMIFENSHQQWLSVKKEEKQFKTILISNFFIEMAVSTKIKGLIYNRKFLKILRFTAIWLSLKNISKKKAASFIDLKLDLIIGMLS